MALLLRGTAMTSINGFGSLLTMQRMLNLNSRSIVRSLERLATGQRINRGADDPAGLISSENLRAMLSALEAEVRSLNRADHLHLISWYDNSENNRYNPDPRNWIGFGNRSMDEMAHTWMNIFYLSEEEFEQRVEARRAKHANN